ncbi:DUF1828 domain-containing protein [Spirochaetota bacterium]
MNTIVFQKLKQSFNNRISFREKKEGTYQIVAPFYHEDGDMYDIFLEFSKNNGKYRICDHGLTLMRLSYTYELDTPKKEEIFFQILLDNNVYNDNGNLFIEVQEDEHVYNAIMRFSQVISKVTNMQIYRRELVKSLFYEDLKDFILNNLLQFVPSSNFLPITDREDLEVDFRFEIKPKNLFLFGVKDNAKARLVSISCLEYLRKNVSFRSIIVHEDFDQLSSKDRRIITNVVDKQFTDIADFKANALSYFERETA